MTENEKILVTSSIKYIRKNFDSVLLQADYGNMYIGFAGTPHFRIPNFIFMRRYFFEYNDYHFKVTGKYKKMLKTLIEDIKKGMLRKLYKEH